MNVIPSKAEVLLSGVSLEEVKSQLGEQAALTVEAAKKPRSFFESSASP